MQQYELNLDIETKEALPTKRIRRRAKPLLVSDSQDSLGARNRLLIARYYYWTEVRRRRFDDVMRILSKDEFFVGERTISNTLLDLSDYLNDLYRVKKDIRDFKKEYPSWNWDSN